jgi:hypothetical protein
MSRKLAAALATGAAALAVLGPGAPAATAAPAGPHPAALGLPTLPQFAGSVWTADKTLRLTADITGDHRADLVGFGDGGVWTAVAKADGTYAPATRVLANFAVDAGGWRIDANPRWLADITGDGRADIVGLGNAGVYTAVSNGDGTFGPVQFAGIAQWGASTRTAAQNYKFFVTDMSGDHRADIVAIRNDRVEVANGRSDGYVNAAYVASYNFDTTRYDYASLNVTDVTGDGRADVLGVAKSGPYRVFTGVSAGGTFSGPIGSTGTFSDGELPRLREIGDVTGDHQADLVENDVNLGGTWVAAGHADGTFAPFVKTNAGMGHDAGWTEDRTPRTLADVTGDGVAEQVGLGEDGTYVSTNGMVGNVLGIDDYSYDHGWRVGTTPRYLADVNGDGEADIVGFGNTGVYVALAYGNYTFIPVASPYQVTVPDVRGLTQPQANAALSAVGLGLNWTPESDPACESLDRGWHETPGPGSGVLAGTTITVTYGRLPKGHSCQ